MKKLLGLLPISLIGLFFTQPNNVSKSSTDFTSSVLVGEKDGVGNYLIKHNSSKIDSNLKFFNETEKNPDDINRIEVSNQNAMFSNYLDIFGISLLDNGTSTYLYIPFWNNFNDIYNKYPNLFKFQSKGNIHTSWANNAGTSVSINDTADNNLKADQIQKISIQTTSDGIKYKFAISVDPNQGWNLTPTAKTNLWTLTSNLNLSYSEQNKSDINIPMTVTQSFYFDSTYNKLVNVYTTSSVNKEYFNNTAVIQSTTNNDFKYSSSLRDLNVIYVNYLDSQDTPWETKAWIISLICGTAIIIGGMTFYLARKSIYLKSNREKNKLIFINQSNAFIANDIKRNKK